MFASQSCYDTDSKWPWHLEVFFVEAKVIKVETHRVRGDQHECKLLAFPCGFYPGHPPKLLRAKTFAHSSSVCLVWFSCCWLCFHFVESQFEVHTNDCWTCEWICGYTNMSWPIWSKTSELHNMLTVYEWPLTFDWTNHLKSLPNLVMQCTPFCSCLDAEGNSKGLAILHSLCGWLPKEAMKSHQRKSTSGVCCKHTVLHCCLLLVHLLLVLRISQVARSKRRPTPLAKGCRRVLHLYGAIHRSFQIGRSPRFQD